MGGTRPPWLNNPNCRIPSSSWKNCDICRAMRRGERLRPEPSSPLSFASLSQGFQGAEDRRLRFFLPGNAIVAEMQRRSHP